MYLDARRWDEAIRCGPRSAQLRGIKKGNHSTRPGIGVGGSCPTIVSPREQARHPSRYALKIRLRVDERDIEPLLAEEVRRPGPTKAGTYDNDPLPPGTVGEAHRDADLSRTYLQGLSSLNF